MELKTIYEDNDLLVIDKAAGIIVFPEDAGEKPPAPYGAGKISEKTLIDFLLEKFPNLKDVDRPPRRGIVHRLDKDTSGILLVAKNNKALIFFQKQFKENRVEKKYLALAAGDFKADEGIIETLIGRSPKDKRKQKVYFPGEPEIKRKKLRKAITEYRVLKRFKNHTLIEVRPETGRKHQIRVHLSYLGHPVAGDKLYGFKNQPWPEGLKRQFLHASYLKIKLPDGQEKEFESELPEDLKEALEKLNSKS